MKMTFKQIQDDVIKKYHITINEHSDCLRRTHAHIKERMVCKWSQKNSITSTFTLFHEIGHIETTKSKMRRCESEFYATIWAIEELKKYGVEVPDSILLKYQRYIDMELGRGIRRGGSCYPSELKLPMKYEKVEKL